jgi:hypothetical protein
MLHSSKKVRQVCCQWPRGKGDPLSSSRGDRIGGRDASINLRDEGDCGCMRKDSCASAEPCTGLSPYTSGEGPATESGAPEIGAEDEDGSSRNVSLGLRVVCEILCADARPV